MRQSVKSQEHMIVGCRAGFFFFPWLTFPMVHLLHKHRKRSVYNHLQLPSSLQRFLKKSKMAKSTLTSIPMQLQSGIVALHQEVTMHPRTNKQNKTNKRRERNTSKRYTSHVTWQFTADRRTSKELHAVLASDTITPRTSYEQWNVVGVVWWCGDPLQFQGPRAITDSTVNSAPRKRKEKPWRSLSRNLDTSLWSEAQEELGYGARQRSEAQGEEVRRRFWSGLGQCPDFGRSWSSGATLTHRDVNVWAHG